MMKDDVVVDDDETQHRCDTRLSPTNQKEDQQQQIKDIEGAEEADEGTKKAKIVDEAEAMEGVKEEGEEQQQNEKEKQVAKPKLKPKPKQQLQQKQLQKQQPLQQKLIQKELKQQKMEVKQPEQIVNVKKEVDEVMDISERQDAVKDYDDKDNDYDHNDKNDDNEEEEEKKKYLANDYKLNDYDVICGRGRTCYNHRGNIRFRDIVQQQLTQYMDAKTKTDKTLVIYDIIQYVRRTTPTAGGGFVKKDHNTGKYYEVGDFLAREKTSQAFRDILHEQYKSSNATKRHKRKLLKETSTRPTNSRFAIRSSVNDGGGIGGEMSTTSSPSKEIFSINTSRALTDQHDPLLHGDKSSTMANNRSVSSSVATILHSNLDLDGSKEKNDPTKDKKLSATSAAASLAMLSESAVHIMSEQQKFQHNRASVASSAWINRSSSHDPNDDLLLPRVSQTVASIAQQQQLIQQQQLLLQQQQLLLQQQREQQEQQEQQQRKIWWEEPSSTTVGSKNNAALAASSSISPNHAANMLLSSSSDLNIASSSRDDAAILQSNNINRMLLYQLQQQQQHQRQQANLQDLLLSHDIMNHQLRQQNSSSLLPSLDWLSSQSSASGTRSLSTSLNHHMLRDDGFMRLPPQLLQQQQQQQNLSNPTATTTTTSSSSVAAATNKNSGGGSGSGSGSGNSNISSSLLHDQALLNRASASNPYALLNSMNQADIAEWMTKNKK